MATITEQTVSEIAIENPASARVFESFGIDYCCGGKILLRDACFNARVSPETVLQLLDDLKEAAGEAEPEKWVAAPFTELTGHIVSEHHDYVRTEGPRLLELLQKVKDRHEWVHPEVTTINDVFAVPCAIRSSICWRTTMSREIRWRGFRLYRMVIKCRPTDARLFAPCTRGSPNLSRIFTGMFISRTTFFSLGRWRWKTR
jgi:hypothetical protein